MPLSEVRPGMMATVHTVFEGSAVEEFPAEIVAVMENFLGPRQDLILARLKGPKAEFTGVVAGMSGSPVYVDGRLVGALSYRLGQFTKEPIAGVTPIEYMLALPRPVAAQSAAAPGASPAALTPIEVPLVVAGVPAAVLRLYADDLSRLGLHGMSAGGGRSGAAPQAGPPSSLKGGDPIAATLVTGDIMVAATGTVTLVDGDRVMAFGHPSFLRGAAQMPMARAEVYLTLASLANSVKLSHVLETIGTFNESRLPGIAGELGRSPEMLPVTVNVSHSGGPPMPYHYELARHRDLSPVLLGIVTAATLFNVPTFAAEMSYALDGVIDIDGHDDVVLRDLYAGFTEQDSGAAALAGDVQAFFSAVWQNRFAEAPVRSVNLTISTVEKGRLSLVEGVYPSRRQVRPGETAEFRVLMRSYRGEPMTRTFTWRIPDGEPAGTLTVHVGGSNVLGAAERAVLSRQAAQVDNIDQLIALLNGLRGSDQLYFKVTRRAAGAVVHSEIMPSLPPSVAATLSTGRGTGEVTPLADTTIHEESLGMDVIVVGGTTLQLNVVR